MDGGMLSFSFHIDRNHGPFFGSNINPFTYQPNPLLYHYENGDKRTNE